MALPRVVRVVVVLAEEALGIGGFGSTLCTPALHTALSVLLHTQDAVFAQPRQRKLQQR